MAPRLPKAYPSPPAPVKPLYQQGDISPENEGKKITVRKAGARHFIIIFLFYFLQTKLDNLEIPLCSL